MHEYALFSQTVQRAKLTDSFISPTGVACLPGIICGSVAAKFEYKAFPKLAASTIESLYIRIYMAILWPNIEYGATK
jgi:hypothetical protein